MAGFIRLLLENFTVTFLVLGFITAGIRILKRPKEARTSTLCWHIILSDFLFWAIGITYLYNGVAHTVFGDATAVIIGWAQSPFQMEVGFASLGFALVGFLAVWGSFDLRLGAILGVSCFLLGAAGTHIYEMIVSRNFAEGNAGPVFYTDILVPLIGLFLLFMNRPSRRGSDAAHAGR